MQHHKVPVEQLAYRAACAVSTGVLRCQCHHQAAFDTGMRMMRAMPAPEVCSTMHRSVLIHVCRFPEPTSRLIAVSAPCMWLSYEEHLQQCTHWSLAQATDHRQHLRLQITHAPDAKRCHVHCQQYPSGSPASTAAHPHSCHRRRHAGQRYRCCRSGKRGSGRRPSAPQTVTKNCR